MTTDRRQLTKTIASIEKVVSDWAKRLDVAQQLQDSRLMETALKRKRHYETKLSALRQELADLDKLILATPTPVACTFCGRHEDVLKPLIFEVTRRVAICEVCCTKASHTMSRPDFLGASAIHKCSFCGHEQDFENREHLLVGCSKSFICAVCVDKCVEDFAKNR